MKIFKYLSLAIILIAGLATLSYAYPPSSPYSLASTLWPPDGMIRSGAGGHGQLHGVASDTLGRIWVAPFTSGNVYVYVYSGIPTGSTTEPILYRIADTKQSNGELEPLLNMNYGIAGRNGKIYVAHNRATMADGVREWATVTAGQTVVTVPFVSASSGARPLINIVGVYTAMADERGTAGAGTSLYTHSTVTVAAYMVDSTHCIVEPPVVGVIGVFTISPPAGTNFYTTAAEGYNLTQGYQEVQGYIQCKGGVPGGAGTPVWVVYAKGNFNPITGEINLNTPIPAGVDSVFIYYTGYLNHRRWIGKYDATTLTVENGINIGGIYKIDEPATLTISTIEVAGTTIIATTAVVSEVPAGLQQVGTCPAANAGFTRLSTPSFGTVSAIVAPISNTTVQIDLGGIPFSDIDIWQGGWGVGMNYAKPARQTTLKVPSTSSTIIVDYPIFGVTGVYTGYTLDAGGNVTSVVGDNFYTKGSSYFYAGGGKFNLSKTTPTIYTGEQLPSLDTVCVIYDTYWWYWNKPDGRDLMDTTGTIVLTIPLPSLDSVYVRVVLREVDPVRKQINVTIPAQSSTVSFFPAVDIGSTVYVSYRYSKNWPDKIGVADNLVVAIPCDLDVDAEGRLYVPDITLTNVAGFAIFDADGKLLKLCPVLGNPSVIQAVGVDISDTTELRVYVATRFGRVWRFRGSSIENLVQDEEAFYFSNPQNTDTNNGACGDVNVDNNGYVYISAPVNRDASGPVAIFNKDGEFQQQLLPAPHGTRGISFSSDFEWMGAEALGRPGGILNPEEGPLYVYTAAWTPTGSGVYVYTREIPTLVKEWVKYSW